MSGYKLLLVPVERITEFGNQAAITHDTMGDFSVGLFEMIADAGGDKKITMSRPVYDEIEVVEPPF